MDIYAIYLRKSRMDMEAEAHGEGETLKRHEAALLSLAKQRRLYVGEIYREIVSGDTIAGRPEMQRLLADVEAGRWKGVLCMDESRLARGDTMDQGRVQQAFYYSHTLIVTPAKTFDPESEADQEYFEFGLFMARREYKMINRRLQRGRMASVREGNWVGAWAPYGYKKVKSPHGKGSTLDIVPEEAEVVRLVFQWWTKDHVGTPTIANRLNESGVQTRHGHMWTTQAVRSILDNPVYCGLIRYSYRKHEKRTVGGEVVTKAHFAAYEEGKTIFPGKHPPIISRELFEESLTQRKWVPGTKLRPEYTLQNPFAGLLHCANCGRVMNRNKGKTGASDRVICWYPECKDCGSTTIPILEQVLIDTLRMKLADLEIPMHQRDEDSSAETLIQNGIATTQKEMEKLLRQKDTAFDLVEQGVYTPAVFSARMQSLAERQDALEERMKHLAEQLESIENARRTEQELAPKIRHVVELYPVLEDAQAKNDLLRTCISGIIYKRPKGSSIDELLLSVFYLA